MHSHPLFGVPESQASLIPRLTCQPVGGFAVVRLLGSPYLAALFGHGRFGKGGSDGRRLDLRNQIRRLSRAHCRDGKDVRLLFEKRTRLSLAFSMDRRDRAEDEAKPVRDYLLSIGEEDLRDTPLLDRKAKLESHCGAERRASSSRRSRAARWVPAVHSGLRMRLEGIVSKHQQRRYRARTCE